MLSSASTESLISRTLDELLLTPMEDVTTSPGEFRDPNRGLPTTPRDVSSIMTTFSKMLTRGLAQTAAQITSTIQPDLHQLGARIEAIEMKADHKIARTNQNTARIQELHAQLDTARSKIDDLENRSRQYNFRIRGLPE